MFKNSLKIPYKSCLLMKNNSVLIVAMNIKVTSLVILAGFLKCFALSETVGGRIVGGYNATDGQFPYSVSLRINNGNAGSELQ